MENQYSAYKLIRVAMIVFVGFVMFYGLLTVFDRLSSPAQAAPLSAPTTVNSDITVDTTWYLTGTPYIVLTSTVSVLNNAVLTIEPGVEVRFASNAQLQIPQGKLIAIGTATSPITFTTNGATTRGIWEGIIFGTNAATSTLQHTVIEYARGAVQINNSGTAAINVYSSTLRYLGDNDGNLATGGAIVGNPDVSNFSYNRIYSSEVGINLTKSGGNQITNNEIYDIDGYCIGIFPSAGLSSANNLIENNHIYNCRNNGIRLEGLSAASKSNNNIVRNNVISNTNSEAIYAIDQSWSIAGSLNSTGIVSNVIFNTALTTTIGTTGTGSNLAAIALIRPEDPNVFGNLLYNNGGSGNYQGTIYITATTSLALSIKNNLIRDTNGSGVVYDGVNSITFPPILEQNAFCVSGGGYGFENRDGSINAAGNWWGTNFPTTGTEFTGTVTINPWILFSGGNSPTILPADGLSTSVITVAMTDGVGNIMPSLAQTVTLSSSLGTLANNQLNLGANGIATTTLTAPTTTGTGVITLTEFCGYVITATVQFQAVDMTIAKSTTITEIIPGQTITYTIPITNLMGISATNIIITDSLPTGTVWLTDTAESLGFSRTQSSPNVVWTHPSLGGYFSRTITMVVQLPQTATTSCGQILTNSVVITTATTDNNSGNNQASSGAVLVLCADVGLSKSSAMTQVVPSQNVTYTISYSNSGTATAQNLVITDTLPTNVTWLTDTAVISGFNRLQTSPSIVWELGNLPVGASGTITLVGQVSGAVCGATLSNSATIATSSPDSNTINQTTTHNGITVICADITISKAGSGGTVRPAETITYTIYYTNIGQAIAENVTITDINPVSGVVDTVLPAPGIVAPGAGGSRSYTVTTNASICGGGYLTNTAYIRTDTAESNTANNVSSSSNTPQILCLPDLQITKNDGLSPGGFVWAGDIISYSITYTNAGWATASNVVLTETLPAYTQFMGTAGWVGGPSVYTYTLGNLLTGSTASISYAVRVALTLPFTITQITNNVAIGSSQTDDNPADNNAVEITPVRSIPDLMVRKSALNSIAPPGGLTTYVITITNSSNSTATNVYITDTLPLSSTYDSSSLGVPVQSSSPVSWTTIGTINPNSSRSFTITVKTDSGICNSTYPNAYLLNRVDVYGAEPDMNPVDNVFTTTSGLSPLIVCHNMAITKTLKSSAASLGKVTTFTLTYRNTGLYTASNVVITDFLATNVTYIADTYVSSTAITSTGAVSWSVGNLGAGQGGSFEVGLRLDANTSSCTGNSITFTNTARIASALSDSNSADNTSAVSSGTIPCNNVDLVVIKNDNVGSSNAITQVIAGGYITYSISVNNLGDLAANNAVLTETVPAYLSLIAPIGTDGWHTVGGNVYTYNIGTLPGTTNGIVSGRVITFVTQVSQNTSCAINEAVNTVQAGSDGIEAYPADNISTEQTPITCNPLSALRVIKNDGLVCAVPGQSITYTITYSNTGNDTLNGVMLTDYKSDYTSFLFGGLNSSWIDNGGNFARTVGTVAPNSISSPLYFQVQVVGATAIPTDVTAITNVIQISGGAIFTEVTSLPLAPNLVVAQNDNIGIVSASLEFNTLYRRVISTSLPPVTTQANNVSTGDIIEYTIVYVNNGRTTATGVVLTETLPLYTTYAGNSQWVNLSGRIYSRTIGSLAPGQGGFVTFRVKVSTLPRSVEWIINRVDIGGNENTLECNLSNSISHEQTPINTSTPYVYLPIIIKEPATIQPTPAPTLTPTPTPTPTPLANISDVAVDQIGNQVFVASPRDDAVYVIDGATDLYNRSVPVGNGPTGLAVLTSTTPGKLFVAHAYATNNWTPGIWIIDTNSLNSRAMVYEGGYVGAAPVKLTANSNTGWQRVYVSNYFDRMPIIYAPTESRKNWVAKKNFQSSYGIATSRRTNLIYMASIDTGELIIFDGSGSETNPNYGACHHAPPEARILRMVAVNQASGHVFVASPPDRNKGQTISKVFVLSEDVLLQNTGGVPSDTSCSWNFIQGTGNVDTKAIPGPAWVTTIELSGAISAGEEGIAVNPNTGKVYVTDGAGDKLFIIDYDTSTNNVTTMHVISVGDNPQGVAVNPVTNKIYVGNARNQSVSKGTVSVVDGTTNTVIKTISW